MRNRCRTEWHSTDWLSGITCEDGYIYADVAEGTSGERESTISVTYSVDEEECSTKTETITVKQKKKGEGGDCDFGLIVDGDTCPGGEITVTVNF